MMTSKKNMAAKNSDVMWERLLTLSSDNGMSLQGQIRQLLVSAILDGHLSANMPVPSSRDLAERLGVARNTVVLAYQQLVDEGYLISRQRSGYFVDPASLAGRIAPRPETIPTPEGVDWNSRLRYRPSQQRNIAKPADWQDYKYPFIYGQFDPVMFPTNDWRECCLKALGVSEIRDWAPDLISRDDPTLIEQIRTRVLPLRGVWAAPEDIIITIGAQHALYLLADLLVDANTTVGIEVPGYPDARNIFSCRTQRVTSLQIDRDGLQTGGVLGECDYVYVTPSHQSPTTVTMPLERREELLRLAQVNDFLIIEDDYETEGRFSEYQNPALKSLDQNNRVIYVGSLSKTLAPGLRLGYIVAPRYLITELRALRRLMIRHPTAFIQRSFALFLSLGHYDSLIRRLSLAHRERAKTLVKAVDDYLPDTTYVPVRGGSSCWLTGPAWLDCRELAARCSEKGILIEPGHIYFPEDAAPMNHFRLGFGSIRPARIEPGIQILGEVINGMKPSAKSRH
jgi:GntR family transcriptional regulator / MocR family aminotransferase